MNFTIDGTTNQNKNRHVEDIALEQCLSLL